MGTGMGIGGRDDKHEHAVEHEYPREAREIVVSCFPPDRMGGVNVPKANFTSKPWMTSRVRCLILSYTELGWSSLS